MEVGLVEKVDFGGGRSHARAASSAENVDERKSGGGLMATRKRRRRDQRRLDATRRQASFDALMPQQKQQRNVGKAKGKYVTA